MKLCKTCGHEISGHDDENCDQTTFMGKKCTCKACTPIEINNQSQLSHEFDEAFEEDRKYLESSKIDGIYQIKDFDKAVILHERQVTLWKKLISNLF